MSLLLKKKLDNYMDPQKKVGLECGQGKVVKRGKMWAGKTDDDK